MCQIFNGLVQFDAHLKPLPAIAEFWEASRDGRVWTFTLRRGVKFHHGREVTAQDFVYSFTRLLDPTKPGPVTELLRRIQGASAFMQGKTTSIAGLQALDPYLLQIVLAEPFAPSLEVLPPGMPGYDPDLWGYYYNPAKAKQLLAEAGYSQGDGFPVVQLWTVSKTDSTKAALAVYKENLAELGVQVDIHYATDWAAYDNMLRQGQLPMFRVAWYADIPALHNFFAPLLYTADQPNYMFYQNPKVDQLLEQAREERNEAQRIALYRQAERIVIDDAPWLPQHHQVFEYLYQPSVQGVEISLLGDRWMPMNKSWLKRSHVEGSGEVMSSVQPSH